MWPPTRPVWPPWRSVFRGRGAGEARLSSGVRSGTGLQGRWGSCDNQHVRSRHGLGCSQRSGQPQIGSCGGRVDPLAGTQLAIDTTLVSPLRRDGTARARAANHDGAALEDARRRKEATFPELPGEGGRARLVVLAAEVGGRWSAETAQFLTALANARAQEVPQVLQGRAETAWVKRWSAILACTAARAFTVSLLDRRPLAQARRSLQSKRF